MAIQDHCYKQVDRYTRLRKQNWIILDSLGNIDEIYDNLTVMSFLNLNHF